MRANNSARCGIGKAIFGPEARDLGSKADPGEAVSVVVVEWTGIGAAAAAGVVVCAVVACRQVTLKAPMITLDHVPLYA